MAKRHKTGGRRPGSRNKLTTEVRAAVLDAFVQLGGVDYLVRVANEYPAAFSALLGKIPPTEMATDGPITHEVVLKWMTPEMAEARGLVGSAEKMTAYEIGQQINRRGYDAPDTVDPVPPQSPATVAHHRTLQRRPFGGRLQSSRQVPLLMMANVGTQLPNLSKADAHRS